MVDWSAGCYMWLVPQAGTHELLWLIGFQSLGWVQRMSVGLVIALIVRPPHGVDPMTVGLSAGFVFGLLGKLCAAFIAGLSGGEIATKHTQ